MVSLLLGSAVFIEKKSMWVETAAELALSGPGWSPVIGFEHSDESEQTDPRCHSSLLAFALALAVSLAVSAVKLHW